MVSPPPTVLTLKDGLRQAQLFTELLGDQFVMKTAGNYRSAVKSAQDELEARIRTSLLHPLAQGFAEYLSLPPIETISDSNVSHALVSLCADAAAIAGFRDVWDDGRNGLRRRNLVSRLRDSALSSHLLTEYRLAAFYQHQRWVVDHRSAQVLPGMDLVVERDGVCADVECKFVYPWSGQRVHDPDFDILFHRMAKRFEVLSPTTFEVKVVADDRLDLKDAERLIDESFGLAATGRTGVAIDGYSIHCTDISAERFTDDDLGRIVQRSRQVQPNYHIAFQAIPVASKQNRLGISLIVGSRKPDDIVGALLKVIQRAQHQLPGDKPGVVSVYFPLVVEGQIELDEHSILVSRVRDTVEAGKWPKISALLLFWPNPGWRDGSLSLVGGTTAQFINGRAQHALPSGFSFQGLGPG